MEGKEVIKDLLFICLITRLPWWLRPGCLFHFISLKGLHPSGVSGNIHTSASNTADRSLKMCPCLWLRESFLSPC